MISDTLSAAAAEIRQYLSSPATRDMYVGATRKRLQALVAEMDRVCKTLDDPPELQSATAAAYEAATQMLPPDAYDQAKRHIGRR